MTQTRSGNDKERLESVEKSMTACMHGKTRHLLAEEAHEYLLRVISCFQQSFLVPALRTRLFGGGRHPEKIGKAIGEFLLSAIEEVGDSKVLEVVTNGANCKFVGKEIEKIYEKMDNMVGEIKDIMKGNIHEADYDRMEDIIMQRWEEVSIPLHCLGFAFTLRFYDLRYLTARALGETRRKVLNEDKEVIQGVMESFERISESAEEAKLFREQFARFHMRKGFYAMKEDEVTVSHCSSSSSALRAMRDLGKAQQAPGGSRIPASAKKTFDETLEAHVRMTRDLQRTDLKLNGFVPLPHSFGKTYRVAVFAEGAAADEARHAGADIVGGPELVENIRTGQLKVDFHKCIATPSMMEHVKKLSRHLKQLMPDAKKGTLTNDISRTVKEAKVPSLHFKKDKTAIVHIGLWKLSFSEDALRDNVGAFVNALLLAKPAGLKKSSKYAGYVDSFHICSTMGPSFPISIQSLSLSADRYNRLQVR
ncbi:hypothetical protein OROMI_017121 [Orobanche minor]